MTDWTIYLRVNVGRSMETVSQSQAFPSKLLKYKDPHLQRTEVSRSTGAEKNSLSRGDFGVMADNAVNYTCRNPAPTLGYSSAATRQENRWELGSWRAKGNRR
jgi:hypothetical protein